MSKEDQIREILDETVKVISTIQDNPSTWQSWLVYLLAQMEAEATTGGSARHDSFIEMLSTLQDAIRNRMRTGGWN